MFLKTFATVVLLADQRNERVQKQHTVTKQIFINESWAQQIRFDRGRTRECYFRASRGSDDCTIKVLSAVTLASVWRRRFAIEFC